MRKLAVAALMLGGLVAPALAQTSTPSPQERTDAQRGGEPQAGQNPATAQSSGAQSSGGQSSGGQSSGGQSSGGQSSSAQPSSNPSSNPSSAQSSAQAQAARQVDPFDPFNGGIRPLPEEFLGEWVQVDATDEVAMRINRNDRVQSIKDPSVFYGVIVHNNQGGIVLSNDQVTCTFDVVWAANYQTMILRQTHQMKKKDDSKGCPQKAVFLAVDQADELH